MLRTRSADNSRPVQIRGFLSSPCRSVCAARWKMKVDAEQQQQLLPSPGLAGKGLIDPPARARPAPRLGTALLGQRKENSPSSPGHGTSYRDPWAGWDKPLGFPCSACPVAALCRQGHAGLKLDDQLGSGSPGFPSSCVLQPPLDQKLFFS